MYGTNVMTYIGIGLGTVSGLHESKLAGKAELIAAIDINEKTHNKVKGIPVFNNFDEWKEKGAPCPLFWIVRTPNESHFELVEKISAQCPVANILVEKPVCLGAETERMRAFLETYKGKICVNENYLQSNGTKTVIDLAEKYFDSIESVYIEMSKNRKEDFDAGRYLDPLGAFAYEGPHMLTILKQLDMTLKNQCKGAISYNADTMQTSLHVEVKDADTNLGVLKRQGSAHYKYNTAANVNVELYTSMIGKILFDYSLPKLCEGIVERRVDNSTQDVRKRYRVVHLKGNGHQGEEVEVIGFYEPMDGFPRSKGACFVIKHDQIVESVFPIEDDTMGQSLHACVDYFREDRSDNPSGCAEALEIVEMMNALASQ